MVRCNQPFSLLAGSGGSGRRRGMVRITWMGAALATACAIMAIAPLGDTQSKAPPRRARRLAPPPLAIVHNDDAHSEPYTQQPDKIMILSLSPNSGRPHDFKRTEVYSQMSRHGRVDSRFFPSAEHFTRNYPGQPPDVLPESVPAPKTMPIPNWEVGQQAVEKIPSYVPGSVKIVPVEQAIAMINSAR